MTLLLRNHTSAYELALQNNFTISPLDVNKLSVTKLACKNYDPSHETTYILAISRSNIRNRAGTSSF